MSKYINDWKPEVESLLKDLIAAGCTLQHGDNGEDEFRFGNDMDKFIENLTACDEARLHVSTPLRKSAWLYLVFGNSPGELVSDYIVDDTLDKVTEYHYAAWEGKEQPKKPCPYFAAEELRVARAANKLNDNLTSGKLGVVYYGTANGKPALMPVIKGARFYTKPGQSFGRDCTDLWYGVERHSVQTKVQIDLLTNSNGEELFPR